VNGPDGSREEHRAGPREGCRGPAAMSGPLTGAVQEPGEAAKGPAQEEAREETAGEGEAREETAGEGEAREETAGEGEAREETAERAMERAPGSGQEAAPPQRARAPRESAPVEDQVPVPRPRYDHRVLKSLLGAWALAACTAEETSAIETHLSACAGCADEALRLRDAVGLLHPEDSLDLDPMLRSRVLESCHKRRPPRLPVPDWAAPYDAETARLDALLRDMVEAEWKAPVWLRWFDGRRQARRQTTVAGVIAHLLAVDGLVAGILGLPDPLGDGADAGSDTGTRPGSGSDPGTGSTPHSAGAEAQSAGSPRPGPSARTEDFWHTGSGVLHTPRAREPWREQGHAMVRTVSFAGRTAAGLDVSYGDFTLPLKDAFLDRAFECWMHAEDIAGAIDYPYGAPTGEHMHRMVDLSARLLPGSIAWRRRTGLAAPPQRLTAAGTPGRALHLEVEGEGGGDWYIPLDSPAATASPEGTVAHVALDGYEFCQLAAGHLPPRDAAAGLDGDREAIEDVLYAAASLSRM
jgi:hypothetical protein